MVVRSCIPLINTVSHGDQIVHCTNHQCHKAIRSCTAPINSVTGRSDGALHQSTVSQGDQIVHCTNQQCHRAIRWCIAPINSVTRRSDRALHQSTVSQGDQIVHCTNQQCHRAIRWCIAPINSVTGRSDGALHQSAQYHKAIRWKTCEDGVVGWGRGVELRTPSAVLLSIHLLSAVLNRDPST